MIGAGLSLLQTAANPYVSILGPIESAAQRIAVMGICNKTAGIVAPLVLGALVLNGIGDFAGQVAQADAPRSNFCWRVRRQDSPPYTIMAVVLALLAFWALRSPLPEIKASEVNAQAAFRA